MKKIMSIVAVFMSVLFVGLFAFAQLDLPSDPTTTNEVISALASLIGGVQGASTLAIVVLVGQFLAKFVLSPLWESLKLDPKYKFVVFGLTQLIAAIAPLMIQGQSFIQALSSGVVLLLVVQYGHRIYELFIETKPAV
jgi:hypothetical protein